MTFKQLTIASTHSDVMQSKICHRCSQCILERTMGTDWWKVHSHKTHLCVDLISRVFNLQLNPTHSFFSTTLPDVQYYLLQFQVCKEPRWLDPLRFILTKS